MSTTALTIAQRLLTLRHKDVIALGLTLLHVVGLTLFANAQDVTYIIFGPPGSTFTQPNSINREGAITGYYKDSNGVTHGFRRSREATITTFDTRVPTHRGRGR